MSKKLEQYTILPKKKMQAYLKYCESEEATGSTFCDNCGNAVEIKLSPYFYDKENNDVYFASLCPECGELIIVKE